VRAELLAPSEACGLLHVLERLLVLAVLRMHSHARHDERRDAARDAEAPVDARIHGRNGI
jgi:hypothetical protein